ncbi:MAG TPA: GNAT family N-acetyltransferase, partial [Hanamia sp.]
MKQIEIGTLQYENFQQLLEAMKAAYPLWSGNYWREETIKKLIDKFPQGQIVLKVDNVVIGCALSIIVDYKRFGDAHTYKQITGNYSFNTHDPENGNVLYGIEIFVHPEHRGLRLGRRLYDARKDLCERLNLQAIIFGGRIPEYHKHADTLSPKEFIQKVKRKEIYDPVLSFQLSNDFHVKKVLKNYMPEDVQSKEFATLLQWDNVYYSSEEKTLFNAKTYVRLGLIQWQMRSYKNMDEMFAQVEFFIDSISAYKSDFALLPELFNGPLLAEFNDVSEAEAMRSLAKFTPDFKKRFSELAIRYNVNIITGSVPSIEGDSLKNIGYLCHRNGNVDQYEKIHITSDETKFWGITGGNSLSIF